jgi:hypothetical protein
MGRSVLAALVLVFGFASISEADFVYWVSAAGNDANFCTRAAPCRSFARATALAQQDSVIGVLDSGDYGPLVITRSVTIEGGANVIMTMTPGGGGASCQPGVTVNAGSSAHVTIRNLTLIGVSSFSCVAQGIRATSVGNLHVERTTFAYFADRAIDFLAAGGRLNLRDVTVTDCVYGVYVANAFATIDRLTASNNTTAVIAAGSSIVSIARSTVSGNGTAVAAAYGPTAQINVDECVLSDNQWAVVAGQGATAYLNNTSIFNSHLRGLYNDGTSFLVSFGNNRFAGNLIDGSFTSGAAVR